MQFRLRYLYDEVKTLQEMNKAYSNTITASASARKGTDATQASLIAKLVTAGIDSTLLRQRLNASGTTITAAASEHLLADANNNTIALTDSPASPGTPAAITTRYDYSAYGETSQTTLSGTASDNAQQYTGRENDNTGLMYYRARYYLPGCARFISEDPIGWASGQVNNYAYVGGDPVSNTDPTGNILPAFVLGAIANGVIGAISGAAGAYAKCGDPWAGAFWGGLTGAAVGAAGALAIPGIISSQMIIRAMAGAVGNIAGQHSGGPAPTNWPSFWGSVAGGAAGGVLAPRGWGAGADATSNLGNIAQRMIMGLPGSGVSSTSNVIGTNMGNRSGSCNR